MAFKFTLVSDVRSVLKGTQDVDQALDQVADSLDDLARDTAQDADKAATQLERKFTDAFDKVKTEAKTAGKGIGDGVQDGARRAGDGVDDFKDEAKQSVRETAASFTDVNDALDLVQEVAANAFVGFGPAGMAAGAAAAIGIGLVKTSLDAAKEKADDTVEMIHSISSALRDAGGVAGYLADSMTDIVDEKEWYEFWQKLSLDRLTLMTDQVRQLGISSDDVFRAMSGDMEAYDRVAQQAIRNTSEANLQATTTFLDSIRQQGDAVNAAKQWNEDYANSSVAAQAKIEAAQQDAADVASSWADSLADHLNVAADGLDGFVKKGKLDLGEWADAVERRAKQVSRIEHFKVDVFPKLSPEAQQAFAELPTETQNEIAKAYRKGSKGDKHKIEATLEAQVKVDPKLADTKVAAVNIPTTVDTAAAQQQVTAAADAAQREANQRSNEIEFKTRIDRDDLQRQVDRAAASITPPTITVKTRVQKEVP